MDLYQLFSEIYSGDLKTANVGQSFGHFKTAEEKKPIVVDVKGKAYQLPKELVDALIGALIALGVMNWQGVQDEQTRTLGLLGGGALGAFWPSIKDSLLDSLRRLVGEETGTGTRTSTTLPPNVTTAQHK
jgi:hypothetical protein